jgi:ribonucleoside-diphosphate reductase beta chain
VNDFLNKISETERTILKRTMLAIGVVENKVKTFWARIDLRMPKTEIADVGHTFAGNEVIHKMTYEKLLNLLGLGQEFSKVSEVQCMQGRAEYLGKYLQGVYSKSNREFTKSLILFTLLVENASLFSQFLIVSSFKKYNNLFSNFNSVISATAREETIHAQFGIDLINIIRKENPDWFDEAMESKVKRNIDKAFVAECGVLDWIFEEGELDFLPKASIVEYLKYRFNDSLTKMGYDKMYEVDEELIKPTEFLEVQLLASSSFDFFNEKSTDYSQNTAFDEEDIWD